MTKAHTPLHTPTFNIFSADPEGSPRRWFDCSCGKSGSVEDNEADAAQAHATHVAEYQSALRTKRIRDAAPELLEALEAIAGDDFTPQIGHNAFQLDIMLTAVQDKARAAVAKARGESQVPPR